MVSRIDTLLMELAPNGVEFRALGDVCRVFNGYAFKSELFNSDGVGLPLIRIRDVNTGLSDTYFSGDFDDRWIVESGDILIGMDGDFRVNRWRHGRALLNQRVCRLQDFSPQVLPAFIYYQIQDELDRIHASTTGSTVKHLSSRDLERSRVPVPPIEIQREIVRILDQFTQLDAGLESELEARLRQYAFYRDELLDFDRASVPRAPMGTLGIIFGGLNGKSKSDFTDGNARYVSYNNVFNNLAVKLTAPDYVRVGPSERQRTLNRGDVIFTGSSETADEVAMSSVVTSHVTDPLYLNSFSIGYRLNDPSQFDPNFLKHLFRSRSLRQQLTRTASGVTRFNVSKSRLAAVDLPLLELAEQRRTAKILDTLHSLANDPHFGIPAELKLRRQQYEHYRNRLLAFDRALS